MRTTSIHSRNRIYIIHILLILVTFVGNCAYAQVLAPPDSVKADSLRKDAKLKQVVDTLHKQYDFGNLVQDILHPRGRTDTVQKKPSGITIIPNIASNPSIGFQIGIKAVAGRKLGADPSTLMSVAATSLSITTKGILYFYVNHNIYTNANHWNLQGNIVAAKTLTPDFGIGIAHNGGGSAEDQILNNEGRKPYVLHSLYYNIREKVYKEVSDGLFVGAGLSFDIRRSIEDRISTTPLTPNNIYSDRYGFNPANYSANGLLFNVQYTTRDNLNRAYKGIYLDVGLRANQTWIGSTRNAVQVVTDFRKYWSLSKRNPEHVIAFWNWGSYLIGGALPYLELPGTGRDPAFRSGRGYTVTYFKGTQYFYSEAEYRFPITRNKFISGVTFFNVQTANDDINIPIFKYWQPGGGAGLRVLFNKATRTNLCLDYAFGRYGSKGFFLGLNEAF